LVVAVAWRPQALTGDVVQQAGQRLWLAFFPSLPHQRAEKSRFRRRPVKGTGIVFSGFIFTGLQTKRKNNSVNGGK
jgi:hypothetical protein